MNEFSLVSDKENINKDIIISITEAHITFTPDILDNQL